MHFWKMKTRRFAAIAAAAVLAFGTAAPAAVFAESDAVATEEAAAQAQAEADAAAAAAAQAEAEAQAAAEAQAQAEAEAAAAAQAEAEAQAAAEAAKTWQTFTGLNYADTACLIDANTGIVLYDKLSTQQMYPASITKIMTILLALENCQLTDSVAMTAEGTQYAVVGSSNLYTQIGEVFTLEQLIYGTFLKSANDMATQIGYHVGGDSLDNFYAMANAKCSELGCVNSNWHSACGMPDEQHYTCAYDMCLIMAAAIKQPFFRQLGVTREYAIPPTNLNTETRMFASHNLLLVDEERSYSGLVAGKTGYTDAAQHTLVEAAERDGMDLIAVVMHEGDTLTAADDTIRMLDFGFSNFKTVDIGDSQYTVSGGKATIPIGAEASDLVITENAPYEQGEASYVRWDYSYQGKVVGSVVMTAEGAEAYRAQLYGPTATPTPEAGGTRVVTQEEKEDMTKIFIIAMSAIAVIAAILVVVFVTMLLIGKKREERMQRLRRIKRMRSTDRRQAERRYDDSYDDYDGDDNT